MPTTTRYSQELDLLLYMIDQNNDISAVNLFSMVYLIYEMYLFVCLYNQFSKGLEIQLYSSNTRQINLKGKTKL